MKKWFVIYCKVGQDNLVEEYLLNRGYDIYLPLITTEVNKNKDVTIKPKPLFPRYIFIRLAIDTDDFSLIRFTKGVYDFVRIGVNYAIVPDSIIDEIKTFEYFYNFNNNLKYIDSTSHSKSKTNQLYKLESMINQGIWNGDVSIIANHFKSSASG
jgi:transcriptional antiterminator RfaH